MQQTSNFNLIAIVEKFQDSKGVIRSRQTKKYIQYNGQKKRTKWQTMIYKTLHRKLKIEQHKRH